MNVRVKKTKRSLLNAFCKLAKSRRIEEITVSELCREAEVNRTTFYKYYSLPADVVTEAVREIALKAGSLRPDEGQTLYDIMLRITGIFYDNKMLMLLYFQANGNLLPIVYQAVTQAAGDLKYLNDGKNYFLAGGIGGVIAYWMQRECKDSPEAIAQLLTQCVSKL